jgi:ketosteroid isomerase-like protein
MTPLFPTDKRRLKMKRLLVVVAVFWTFGVLAAARENTQVEQKLMQMERDWADAMMKNDASGVARIEADDYSYVMDNMRGDKKGDLADAKNGAFSGSAELSEMKVHVYGDAAVVMGKASLRDAKYKGKDMSGDYLFTDTFVKRNGRWQVVASHSNKVQSM